MDLTLDANMYIFQEIIDKYPNLFKTKCFNLDVGLGWFNLVDQLCQELETLIIEYEKENPTLEEYQKPKIVQIKEKFGALRCYMDNPSTKMNNSINEFEKRSCKICEECGENGILRVISFWSKCICDKCKIKYPKM